MMSESTPPASTVADVGGDIPRAVALELLRRMLLIRMTEEEIAARYAEQKMRCPTHLSIGQEAVAAAAGLALRLDDKVVSTHRAHAHYLGKGGALDPMIAEIHGKRSGCSAGKGGSMHLVDLSAGFLGSTAIVGNTIPVGVGIALAEQFQVTDRVVGIFLGDAAIEEGAFHEAANFAVLRDLPVVFICENNLYSVYSPLDVRQPAGRPIAEFASAYGMLAEHGDGNDVEACYHMIRSAAEHARSGAGPVFLEFATYRWREHCGPNYDNDIGYRTEQEFLEWKSREPLERYVSSNRMQTLLTAAQQNEMREAIRREIECAFSAANEAPYPEPNEMYRDVYAEEVT
tara:strand:+ start:93 stop:1124 length:1032 start_codon:yes stop_codon:yes gene_type:complete